MEKENNVEYVEIGMVNPYHQGLKSCTNRDIELIELLQAGMRTLAPRELNMIEAFLDGRYDILRSKENKQLYHKGLAALREYIYAELNIHTRYDIKIDPRLEIQHRLKKQHNIRRRLLCLYHMHTTHHPTYSLEEIRDYTVKSGLRVWLDDLSEQKQTVGKDTLREVRMGIKHIELQIDILQHIIRHVMLVAYYYLDNGVYRVTHTDVLIGRR